MKLTIERKKDLSEELSSGNGYVFEKAFLECSLNIHHITNDCIFVVVRKNGNQIYIAKDSDEYIVMNIIGEDGAEIMDFILELDSVIRNEFNNYASGDKWILLESYTL